MNTNENEFPREGSLKKHFYGVPHGISLFTDEQMDAFVENVFDWSHRFRDQWIGPLGAIQ